MKEIRELFGACLPLIIVCALLVGGESKTILKIVLAIIKVVLAFWPLSKNERKRWICVELLIDIATLFLS
jgi:hypothetical protein